ncbi:MAG: hypothetical protein JXB14_06095 [Candidatus Altiarchaeota archaeon]|nr:hypothetical protein [Candidatus Altiarchaeota archaeon]
METDKKGQLSFDMIFAIIMLLIVLELCAESYNSIRASSQDIETLSTFDQLATSLALQMNKAYVYGVNMKPSPDNPLVGDEYIVVVTLPYEGLYDSVEYSVETENRPGVGMDYLKITNLADPGEPKLEVYRELLFDCNPDIMAIKSSPPPGKQIEVTCRSGGCKCEVL